MSVILKVWPADYQHKHHLGTCWKCKFLASPQTYSIRNSGVGFSHLCFNNSSRQSQCCLSFENHCIMGPVLFPLPVGLCKVASILTKSLPYREFLSNSTVAFTCCSKIWSWAVIWVPYTGVTVFFHCVVTITCQSTDGNDGCEGWPGQQGEQLWPIRPTYLWTWPLSSHLVFCHWS